MRLSIPRSPGRRFPIPLTIALVLSLLAGSSRAGEAAADGDREKLARLADAVERYLKVAITVDAAMPRETFDPLAVARKVSPDPARLLAWVRESTAFAPYRGALRGPAGVLMDQRGNSLDRSLLLLRLLQAAGHKARLARGELTPAEAEQVIKTHWDAPRELPVIGAASEAERDALIAKLSTIEGLHLDTRAMRDDLEAAALASRARIEDLVAQAVDQTERLRALVLAGGAPPPGGSRDRAITAASEHWWVQLEAGGAWTDLDALAGDPGPGKALTKALETVEVPPGDAALPLDGSRCQEVELRVLCERWDAGRAEPRVALRQVLRPADLGGLPVSLAIAPMSWSEDLDVTAPDGIRKLKTLLAGETRWTPLLQVGGETVVQKGFDEHGDLVDQPVEDVLARTGQSVKDSFKKLIEIGGKKAAPAPSTGVLGAVWIELEIRVPGEAPRVARRDIYDPIGAAKRAAGGAAAPAPLDEAGKLARGAKLYRRVALLVAGGLLSDDFAYSLEARMVIQAGVDMLKALRGAGEKPDRERAERIAAARAVPASILDLAAGRGEVLGDLVPVVVRPNLFAVHRELLFIGEKAAARETIDIIAGDVDFPSRSAEEAFTARLRQGVLETLLERICLRGRGVGANTAALFAASEAQKIEWVAIRGPADPAIAKLKLGAVALARIAADLAGGSLVVAPVAPVASGGKGREGWWRIDPRDGTCLGVMSSGTGSEVEHSAVVHWIFRAIAAADLVQTTIECSHASSGLLMVGCEVCGVAFIVGFEVLAPVKVGGLKGFSRQAGKAIGGSVLSKMCPGPGGEESGGEGEGE